MVVSGASAHTAPTASKVPPKITLLFWILKLLTTAMGEATSDLLVHRANPYLAVVGSFIVFLVALTIQLRAPTYSPWAYWFAVAMVAVFGTMAADVLHVEFGVPYIVSTIAFAIALAIVFTSWFRGEHTLSIHSIVTRRRETFYWTAVLATFAMGTAAGDLLAYTANLGFLSAGIVFAAIFALPALGFRFLNLNAIVAFWFAYVMTRPLGASFADWTGKARHAGGLGYGDGVVAIFLTLIIVALVALVARPTGRHQAADQGVPQPATERRYG